jgi:hypothetical protein
MKPLTGEEEAGSRGGRSGGLERSYLEPLWVPVPACFVNLCNPTSRAVSQGAMSGNVPESLCGSNIVDSSLRVWGPSEAEAYIEFYADSFCRKSLITESVCKSVVSAHDWHFPPPNPNTLNTMALAPLFERSPLV